MRTTRLLLAFALLALLSTTIPSVLAVPSPYIPEPHVVHERRSALPQGWMKRDRLSPRFEIPVSIALKQQNLDRMHEYVMEVSHPESENFGKHWDAARIAETFAPSRDTVDAVSRWMTSHGIASARISPSNSRGWLNVRLSAQEAERLLRTTFWEYEHAETGKVTVGTDEYHVPARLAEHIDFITPTLHFDTKVKRDGGESATDLARRAAPPTSARQPGIGKSLGFPTDGSLPKIFAIPGGLHTILDDLKNCSNSIVPNCLRALYDLPPLIGAPKLQDGLGIVEYTPQAYRQEDLTYFFNQYAKGLRYPEPKFVSIDGGYAQTVNESFNYNGESNLDLEYAMALSETLTTLYQVGDPIESASFSDFLDALDGTFCANDDPSQDAVYPDNSTDPLAYKGPKQCGGIAATKVISTSYGYNEADLTPLYEMRQCNEYAKIALQGVSFFFSSGDYGVAGNEGQCISLTNSTQYINGTDGGRFNPSFPSTCPYVTSVGATQIKPNGTVYDREEACQEVIYSGGGFSNNFAIPSYQQAAVGNYLAQHRPSYQSPQIYNGSGTSRAYPDLSANGAKYLVRLDGIYSHVYGTSASSPTVAAIFSRINEARARVGKGPVGFVNPTLYKNPSAFTDIIEGGNQGCNTPGFTAVEGWDPVTGLGTPNYPKLLAVYLALP